MFKIPHIEEPSERYRVIKYFITLFCGLYIFQGLVTMAVSIWLATQRMYSCHFIGNYFAADYLLLTASLLTTLLGAVGMYKTLFRTNRYFLRTFIFLLVAIVAFEVMSAIVAHVHQSVLGIKLPSDMKATFVSFYSDSLAEICVTSIHKQFQCCGADSFTDLLNNRNPNLPLFPQSCLCEKDTGCSFYQSPTSNFSLSSTPCYTQVFERMTSYLTVFRVVGPVLAGIQLIFFFLVMCFVTRIQNRSIISSYRVQRNGRRPNSEPDLTISQSVSKPDVEITNVREDSEHI